MSEGRKKRKERQRKRELFQKIREDLQLSGDLPVTPEGGLRSEVVPPSSQGEQALPNLTKEAIRRGWAVPEEKKPALVDELTDIVNSTTETNKVKVAAFKALVAADKEQHLRDHPTERSFGANLPGAVTNTTNVYGDVVNNKLVAAQTIREMIERGELGILTEDGNNSRPTETSVPDESSPPSG